MRCCWMMGSNGSMSIYYRELLLWEGEATICQKESQNVRAFNRLILPFRFNPAIFVAGMVVAGVTGSVAMEALDVVYQKYLNNSIERNLELLKVNTEKRKKMEAFKSIVEDAMTLVAIENESFFATVLFGIGRLGSASDSREFFRGLAQENPWLLDEETEKTKFHCFWKS